ncbi:MAG: Ig-like domain-containing protein, partial [Thermoplasmata archaeon]
GEVVEITLYGRDLPTPGWSLTPGDETDPGPTIRVNLGDEIRLRLISEDGLPHVFYIDYDGNGLPTLGLEPISLEFTTETMFNFTADQAGFFTYWCAVHQPRMFGGWITNGPPTLTVTSPTPAVSWTGGTGHDIVFTLDDEDILQNTKLWVNFTHAGGTQGGSIAGPMAGTANVVIPWGVPLLDAADVTVNITAIDLSGARGTTNSAPFEIDSKPPSVEARLPGPNPQDVPRNTRVEARWSEGMNEVSTGDPASFGLRDTADGTWVRGDVVWDGDSRTLMFTPAFPLASDTTFEVHVNASATDDSEPGNAAIGPVSWTFRTSGVSDVDSPSITGILVSPSLARPGEVVSISATITDSNDVASAWIVVAGPDVTLNITLVQFGDQWFLNRSWEAVGTYEFVIGAQDVVGNVNTASGTFAVQESLAGTFGLLVLLGTPLAVGVGVLVFLWIRRRRFGREDEASE